MVTIPWVSSLHLTHLWLFVLLSLGNSLHWLAKWVKHGLVKLINFSWKSHLGDSIKKYPSRMPNHHLLVEVLARTIIRTTKSNRKCEQAELISPRKAIYPWEEECNKKYLSCLMLEDPDLNSMGLENCFLFIPFSVRCLYFVCCLFSVHFVCVCWSW